MERVAGMVLEAFCGAHRGSLFEKEAVPGGGCERQHCNGRKVPTRWLDIWRDETGFFCFDLYHVLQGLGGKVLTRLDLWLLVWDDDARLSRAKHMLTRFDSCVWLYFVTTIH